MAALYGFAHRKGIASKAKTAKARIDRVSKGSVLDDLRNTNNKEYNKILDNIKDATFDQRQYVSCMGTGEIKKFLRIVIS